MGWSEHYNRLSTVSMLKKDKALKEGNIEQAQKFAIDEAKYYAKSKETKAERLKGGVKKIGAVVVSTVGGLLGGGPAGAAAGFVAGSQTATAIGDEKYQDFSLIGSLKPGITFETPPIVNQPRQDVPPDEGDNSFWATGHWVPFALIGAFLFRKHIAKLLKR